jgi:hypothetical protein
MSVFIHRTQYPFKGGTMSNATTVTGPIVITWPEDEYLSEADEASYNAYAAYRVDADARGARRVFATFEAWIANEVTP